MLNLIKLEIKKFKLMKCIKGFLISILAIGAFMCLVTFATRTGDRPFKDFENLLYFVDTLVRIVFIIYSSTILSKLIISEYKNKTMNLMFMYPIKRKKILASKLTIVSTFTFISIIIGNLIIGTAMFLMNKYINFVPEVTVQVISNNIITMIVNAIAASGIALIPLFFGMRKKTTSATIISSIIVTSLLSSTNGNFSLSKILPVTLSVGAIGVFIAYLAIKNIENFDVV